MTHVDHRGRVVLVTGASSGIGWCTARAFAQRGSIVVGVARREERLRELLRECRETSPASEIIAGDLGERAFAERVVVETVAKHLEDNTTLYEVLFVTMDEREYEHFKKEIEGGA